MRKQRHRTPYDVINFVPPFCPNPDCPDHLIDESRGETFRFERRGFRHTRRAPGIVRVLLCKRCGKWFSSSTFFDCYRRRQARTPEAVFRGYCEGQAGRQIARTNQLGLKTVQLLLRRMARQAFLYSLQQLEQLRGKLETDVIFDGLRTFAGSQWEPGDLNTPIAGETLFWLDVDYVGLRRSGRMTPKQERIRTEREERLGRPPQGVAEEKCCQALRRLAGLLPAGKRLVLKTDKDQATARAVRSLAGEIAIEHHTISSKVWREDPRHPLWPVNHEHRLMRHGKKNHTRETLAFSKTAAGLMDRAELYRVWRNNVKGISERDPKKSRTTPAMKLGLTDRPLRADEIFHERLFPKRVGVPPELMEHYTGTVKSRPGERASTYRYKSVTAA